MLTPLLREECHLEGRLGREFHAQSYSLKLHAGRLRPHGSNPLFLYEGLLYLMQRISSMPADSGVSSLCLRNPYSATASVVFSSQFLLFGSLIVLRIGLFSDD